MIMLIRSFFDISVIGAVFPFEIPLLLSAILLLVSIIVSLYKPGWFTQKLKGIRKIPELWDGWRNRRKKRNQTFEEALADTGFAYDPGQDMFYSIKDAWQRNFGYCRLYDEAAAPMGMILDCQPVYFEFEGKKWLIQWWKGQYDLTTGCEVGVFYTDGPDLEIPGVFNGTFYRSVSNEDMLQIKLVLRKKDDVLLTRDDTHWWLTGFKLGMYSEPSDLSMEISITLKNGAMCRAFIRGLKQAGYLDYEIEVYHNTVSLKFDKVHSGQPFTRNPATDRIIQKKNKFMCDQYQEITKFAETMDDKWAAVQKQSPELLDEFLHFGRSREIEKSYRKIKDQIDP